MLEKRGITDSINHTFARITIDLYNSLPIEKILTFHEVIIVMNSIVYYNIFLEKCSHKDTSNTKSF